jgi:hypothetical protein
MEFYILKTLHSVLISHSTKKCILLLFYYHSRKLIKVLLLAFADDKMLNTN